MSTTYTRDELRFIAARAYGAAHGFKARASGHIYRADGAHECHGWREFWLMNHQSIRDWLCWTLTAFETFRAMLNAQGGYRPTISPYGSAAQKRLFLALACEYDFAQASRGDARRAYTPGVEVAVLVNAGGYVNDAEVRS